VTRRSIAVAAAAWALACAASLQPRAFAQRPAGGHAGGAGLFALATDCMACHNGMRTPDGRDASIGTAWRATMMANSARDPYWQAAVRRELTDHPRAAAAIEDECSICHMPMSHTAAHAAGRAARVFAHLPASAASAAAGWPGDAESLLAQDGVSCTLCHQITTRNLGGAESFTGGFVIDTATPIEQRPLFGPFAPEPALQRVMHSATGFQQTEGAHIRQSEMCATCHTLYTTARGQDGQPIARFPEQVPFQEWQHSRYAAEKSCQACHMPEIVPAAPIASVLGQPREGARRHAFVGGNFFVLRMLDRFRDALGVAALPEELDAAARETIDHLAVSTARIAIERAALDGGRLVVDLAVRNLSGHKLPTAYPSRRAWIRLTVRDASGRDAFVSGRLMPGGAIAGNANDENPAAFEPHYREITRQDEVQIYEPILADQSGAVTTGLLRAVAYAKDNRLLPDGFDKRTANADVAVHGDAREDADFTGGSDRIRYAIDVAGASAPFTVEAELLFQPIGFRWADNLRGYRSAETDRFVRYYDDMAAAATATLARATSVVR
jgi:hypothetical protein